jgi:hypothetical protein
MAAKKAKETVVLNDYESVIIFTPVLSEEQLKEVVSKYRSMITENAGELVHEENWGLTFMSTKHLLISCRNLNWPLGVMSVSCASYLQLWTRMH